ncbi:MAG TPA: CorA family divalent cation transporter [Acetobacteraceae bacterium]|jgi:zinc transporter|nr:CorA family divalent cation transporter [Acetobacteraceae bacterium]
MAPASRSPLPGLIAAWRVRQGELPDELEPLEVVAALAAGESGLWLHLNLAEQRVRELLVRLPIPPLARRTLLEADDAPHLDAADGAIYGGVADFRLDSAAGGIPETGLLYAVLTADLLVTAQQCPLHTVHAVSHAPAGETPAELFAYLLHRIAGATGQAIQSLSVQLSRIEDSLLKTGGTQADRQALAALRRTTLRLERVFAPTAETLSLWADAPIGTLADPFCAPVLREERWEGSVRRGLVALQERARIAQDELAGLAAEETNRRLFVLSVISAAMLPATLITGVFGMNVGAVPGVDRDWGFPMAMCLVVGSILAILAALRFGKLL